MNVLHSFWCYNLASVTRDIGEWDIHVDIVNHEWLSLFELKYFIYCLLELLLL